jgi:hypothetical protein
MENSPNTPQLRTGLRKCDVYTTAINKNEIMLFAGRWMELEIIMLSEVSQAQKDKGRIFCLHMWKLDFLNP